MLHKIGSIYQICFVVPNLRDAVEEWTSSGRAGPFYLFENFEFKNPNYKGEAIAPDVSLALGYSGDLNIELIEQHDDTPSIYKEQIDSKGYGFHHFARLSANMDQSIAEETVWGYACSFSAAFADGTRCAYIDTRSITGGFTEYIEYNDGVEGLLGLMHDAAKDWDGTEPLRTLDF